MNNNTQCIITGGAGFIGSHLADKLLEHGCKVTAFDNLSSGKINNISHNFGNPNFKFFKGDLSSIQDIKKSLEEQEVLFHLAAYSKVYVEDEGIHALYDQNIGNTIKLLEGVRKSQVKKIIFTSSSTIYGSASLLPTPEDYGPAVPESHYGASKLACEALVSTYCKQYGISGIILRLANIVGSRSDKGIIYDFIRKLKANPKELAILGNGFQSKSYMHISDFTGCLHHLLLILESSREQNSNNVNVFNVGNIDQINAISIANEICGMQKLGKVSYHFQEHSNGKGWIGDVTQMLLDISKLKSTGWAPQNNSREAIIISAREMIKELSNQSVT